MFDLSNFSGWLKLTFAYPQFVLLELSLMKTWHASYVESIHVVKSFPDLNAS